ncbi:hypothetical protein [Pedobacter alpinus]|uniref:Uncharacterized protein n=1 Tax=Pedobacter alpinus TaxID=1590643 RepID=A0ABW5TQE6_9SPHI
MFEKLSQIVKESKQAFLTSEIKEGTIDAAINEATGVIVDVLKSKLDNGKVGELMSFFKGKDAVYQDLTNMMVNKYANRLNKYFNLNINDAKTLSEQVIPAAMNKFVLETVGNKKENTGVFAFLNWLSGNTINFENLFLRLNPVKLAS